MKTLMDFFKKTETTKTTQTEVELIEEIHNAFKSAELWRAPNSQKSVRLNNLGFIHSRHIVEHSEAMIYFERKYPNYKFITEKSVQILCRKYGLIYGQVTFYRGDVPDKNLHEIEMFKLDDEDYCYGFIDKDYNKDNYDVTDVSIVSKSSLRYRGINNLLGGGMVKCPLEIVAPIHDFVMPRKLSFKEKLYKIKDPIVLQPVIFNNIKYYLIITAWGIEASDELVVNHKMN